MLPPDVTKNKTKIFNYLDSLGVDTSIVENVETLLTAFVHKSYSSDFKEKYEHNERLEFLGDGIIGAIINKLLFIDNGDMPESKLTLYKIAFVREEMLAEVARDIKLGSMMFISNGEEKMGGRDKDALLSDTFEALVGSMYLEFGMDVVEKFIRKYLYTKLEKIDSDNIKSYKTLIQEIVQKQYRVIPEYIDTEHKISDKGNVTQYKSEIHIHGIKKAEGFGVSKKKAQEVAAKNFHEKHTKTTESQPEPGK